MNVDRGPPMDVDTVVTVGDVARSPALQLQVVAGADGLDRTVTWAHVSELLDPTPWLLGGELLLTTGMGVPKSARAQRAYVKRLLDNDVAGLMISAQLHVPLQHEALLRAADDYGLPVLEAPLSVPFVAVVQEVATAVRAPNGSGLGTQLQVFGALRWVVEENLSAAATFTRLERLSGYELALCTPSGRALLPGVDVPAPGSVGVARSGRAGAADRAGRLRASGPGDRRHSRVPDRARAPRWAAGGTCGGGAHRDGRVTAPDDAAPRARDLAP